MKKLAPSFLIGLFAGICAVFVPRMGGLFEADPSRFDMVFPLSFVVMGSIYGAIVGVIVAIIYYDKPGSPSDRLMTGLGVPALLAGAIATNVHTAESNSKAELIDRLAASVVVSEKIPVDSRGTSSFEVLPPAPAAAPGKISWELLLGVTSAWADEMRVAQVTPPSSPQSQWRPAWTPIQAQEANYAIVLETAKSEQEAQSLARQLRPRFPTATAVKTDRGFSVITGVKPKSDAVLEAVQLKKEGASPELLLVK
jgi:hypothetical protein